MKHILKCHDIIKTNFVSGENCRLTDSEGNQWIDFESGIWAACLGHNHPRIRRVMADQMESLIHLGTRFPSMLAEDAAIALLKVTEMPEGKCVFLSSGSEAVELGVQMARHLSGKTKLLTYKSSYLSAFGSAGRKEEKEWHLIDFMNCTEKSSLVEDVAAIPFDEVGAFVLEPGGSGPGYVNFPPAGLTQDIARRVKDAGGLLMANEVTTGFGRTGKWFGFQHYDFQPDIIAMGKGLGSGYPVSAVAMTAEAARQLEETGFGYAQSHQNDPLGTAVAREVIRVMAEERWVEKGAGTGVFFLESLKKLARDYPVFREARGRGMLLALELNTHPVITARRLYLQLIERGFIVGCYEAGNILRFDPALSLEKEDVSALIRCISALIETGE